MPAIAQAALVSEPTAYRYFPDLLSLLTEALCRHVLAYQGAVRAMIAATITRPELAQARPGLRLGLIHHALAPLRDTHRHNAHHRGEAGCTSRGLMASAGSSGAAQRTSSSC
jgi:AcrR family transcriptional regulator